MDRNIRWAIGVFAITGLLWTVSHKNSAAQTPTGNGESPLPVAFEKVELSPEQEVRLRKIQDKYQHHLRAQAARAEALAERLRRMRDREFLEQLTIPQRELVRDQLRVDIDTEDNEEDKPEPSDPKLKSFHTQVENVVKKYYPDAEISKQGATIEFEWNTRMFLVHTRGFATAVWQDAEAELGPEGSERRGGLKSGICGSVTFNSGPYGGQAGAGIIDMHYFQRQIMFPYSEERDAHLDVELKYPDDVPPQFLVEFRELMNTFDQHFGESAK